VLRFMGSQRVTELKVGTVVCVSFLQGEICAEFVCFSTDGQG